MSTNARAVKAEPTVDRPRHYGGTECIEAIEQALGTPAMIAFCKGNAIKYVWRAGAKDPQREAEDLKKAGWYLNYAVEALNR